MKQFAKTVYYESFLQKGAMLQLPEIEEQGLYVVRGALEIDGTNISEGSMAVFNANSAAQIMAKEETQNAVVGGQPVGPRNIFWNFISSRPERIEQAKRDWKAGVFAKVSGDEEEFIPLPE